MKKYFLPVSIIIASAAIFSSCKKTESTILPYTVPTAYDFDNVAYSEATTRVNMWSGLTSYLGKATSRHLSQDTATYLWNNTNSAFTTELLVNLPNNSDALNNSLLSLSGKSLEPTVFKAYIDSMVKVSESNGAAASEGVPGKIGSRLFNYSGLEFNQLVAKGLMGSFQMAAIIDYLNSAASADNNTVTPGTGTAMQHAWDMAFGYTSLPKTYDSSIAYTNTVIDRPLAIGGYFRERGRYIKAGGTIYEAFRTGRAAIGAKDYAVRDKAIATIKEYLEKTLAAACYEYAGIGMTASDLAGRFHGLSEGCGFVLALKYRQPGSKLTDANYQTLLNTFKTSFYELISDASNTKLKEAQAILSSAYGQLQP
jgi:Domain of unknown function (DUF4856)